MKQKLGISLVLIAALGSSVNACGGSSTTPIATASSLASLRSQGKGSPNGEVVGRWALAEMIAPGGDAAEAANARKRIASVAEKEPGVYASFASALYDDVHGAPQKAAEGYINALKAANTSKDPDVDLVSWYATSRLLGLRASVAELFTKNRKTIEALVARPGALGWRASGDLLEWWASEVLDKAEVTGNKYDQLVVARTGCATKIRLAGPFGHGAASDRRASFPPEAPGPWPAAWPEDPVRATLPRVLKVLQHRCTATSAEHAPEGVYYAETFFTTQGDRDSIVAVQGASSVWIDGTPVLTRDLRDWGSWQRFGVSVSLPEGRHRVVARIVNASTSVRLLNLDGTAAGIASDEDPLVPYSIKPVTRRADPNPIDAVVRARNASSPLQAFLAAHAAHVDGLDDVASVLIDPIVSTRDAAAVALLEGSDFTADDPVFPDEVRTRNGKALRERAFKMDTKIWRARAMLILEDAEQRGLIEAVEPLRKLSEEFRDVPEILEQLARLYGRLGWRAERMRALADLAARFPDDVGALRLYLAAIEDDGALADADKIAARIKKLDPDSEVDLERALLRHDWKGAVAELERLGKRRPDRKEIAGRVADVLARSGDPGAAADRLEAALKKQANDAKARFRLADRAYAKGDTTALRKALAEALQVGASSAELRAAIDLLEGATDLHPYRIDGKKIVKEFEAWEKQGHHMDGSAARVLDYAATWVRPDGSSEMLEHEIQRIQSQEAVDKESEMSPPQGLVLRLRVIKPDGSTLEPEHVAGKPTLTMPHLAVGDYLEMEHITTLAGDGQKGRRYTGPYWFFREQDKGYWRSEFILVTPKDKPLEIEVHGQVGEEKKRDLGTFVERKWRVDLSPPAPVEDGSPPITEFLPSVRVGWGVTLDDTLRRIVDLATDETPLDPRLTKKALEIVKGIPESAKDERARLLYRFVVENIQEGKETDGRRVITGLSGSRQSAFHHLVRQLGIPVEFGVVKNKLAMPPTGKMSEAEVYDGVLTRITTERGVRWLSVRDKFAPFGYVPAEMRGQPAFRLVPGTPKDTVNATGSVDAIVNEGRADVRDNGSAAVDLSLTFSGNRAIAWRNVLDKVPEAQQNEFFEKELVTPLFTGGSIRGVQIENRADVDKPLVLKLKIDVPVLAKAVGGQLSLRSLFAMGLDQLASLPRRQTPLLRRSSFRTEVHFQVVLPESMRLPASLPTGEVKFGDAVVTVKDAVHGHAIHLDRVIDLPAGRVQPDEYAAYQKFVREADALVDHDILIGR